ncbi:MAG: hypothetical protein ACK5MO_24280 [Planctomyces sp.]
MEIFVDQQQAAVLQLLHDAVQNGRGGISRWQCVCDVLQIGLPGKPVANEADDVCFSDS